MPNHVHLIAVPDSQERLLDEDSALLRDRERTRRPLVSAGFVERLEKLLNCVLSYKSAVAQGKLFIRTESKVYCITSEEYVIENSFILNLKQ
jgi:hypothetical protein